VTTRLRRRTALALVPVAVLAACTDRGEVTLVSDDGLDKALVAQTTATTPRLLRDMTAFAWDEVILLPEGTKADQIQSLTGQRIVKGDRYLSSATLMVFRTAGKLTMAVMISADVFAAQDARRWFSRDVRPDLAHGFGFWRPLSC